MLAAEFTSARVIRLTETAEPDAAELTAGSVIFQPELTCLCGSDLPFFDGEFEGHEITYPQPIGMSLHEMVGTIVASRADSRIVGQRVLAVPLGQRGFFERFVLPADRIVAIPEGVPDETALLAQPFGTVVWALKKLPNMIDRDVAVVGLGPIGQMFVAGLRNLGARRIIGIDPVDSRCRTAAEVGATHVLNRRAGECESALRDLTDGELPEIVIEAVGHRAQVFDECVQLCRAAGSVLYFGVPPDPLPGISLKSAMLRNIRILTSLHPDFERTFPLAMQWLAEGRVNLNPLITHRFPMASVQEAFDLFRDRREGCIKVLVEFPALRSAE